MLGGEKQAVDGYEFEQRAGKFLLILDEYFDSSICGIVGYNLPKLITFVEHVTLFKVSSKKIEQ